MPGNYTLELELFSLLNGSVSDFEIYADGALLGGYSTTVSSAGSTISVLVPYGGALPTSLEFRFTDSAPGSMDTIEVRAVKINDRYVNTGNYLSGTILNDGGSQTVDVTNNAYLFDASEPASSEFTTGATQTYTAGADTYRDYNDVTPQVFDMLGGRDVAYLGNGADKVNGNGGNDILHGRGGADLLYGAAGNDRLFGGDGNDTLYGGDDNDRIQGDAGEDEIHGGAGVDRLIGGADNDVITGGTGNDTLLGGSGDDYLFGDGDDDTIIGGTGADTIDGGSGADIAYGGAGIDHINGGADDDILVGNGGNDIIHGDGGNDTIYGLEDNDTIFGGAGEDFIDGGIGTDTIDGGAENDILKGGAGIDILDGGAGDDILQGHSLTTQEIRGILNANAGVTYNAQTNSFYQIIDAGSAITANSADIAAQGMILNGVAGHLVNITSATEQTYVTALASGSSFWMGSSDTASEGQWVWTDGAESGGQFWSGNGTGTAFGYENWGAGQPLSNTDYGDYNTHDFKLTASDAAADDRFGNYVAIDGNYTIVGATGNDDAGSSSGSAYIFDTTTGTELFKLTASDAAAGHFFGLGISMEGNYAIISAPGAGSVGAAYIFDINTGSEGIKLLPSDGANSDNFGDSTDISGNYAVIGAHRHDAIGADSGAAYIYDVTTGAELFKLTASDAAAGDRFGSSVAIDGNYAVIGAEFNDDNGSNSGSAYIFDVTTGTELFNLTASDAASGDLFGTSVAVDGNYAVIGAAGNDDNGSGSGSAYIFDITTGTEIFKLTASDAAAADNFGGSVAIDGNYAVIAASGNDDAGSASGSAYVFDITTGQQLIKLTASDGAADDNFGGRLYGGIGVGISGTTITVASRNDDDNGSNSGSTYIYDISNLINITDSAYIDGTGQWNAAIDSLDVGVTNYIVEWDAGLINDDGAIDTLRGGAGNDTIYGYGGNDILDGGADDDIIFGGDGDDTIDGGDGVDSLYGGAGNDIITGGTGNDIIAGGAGNDIINGENGLDIITGGAGVDTIDGGADNDTINLANGDFAAGESIDGGANTDEIILTNATTVDFTTGTVVNVENLTGSAGNDDVTYEITTALNFTTIDLAGGTDNSRVNITGTVDVTALGTPTVSNAENGFITGSAGNDELTITGAQLDALVYGTGIIDFNSGALDTINITSTSADLNILGATDASIQGLEEIDAITAAASVIISISGQTEAFILTGSIHNDTITGGAGDDTIDAAQGSDIVNAGNGNDAIYGRGGVDTINGEAGNDFIRAGDGNDIISGGIGIDDLRGENGNDTINLANGDFVAGESIDGGANTDEIILTNATTVDFTTGTVVNVENLTGSAGNDDVTYEITTALGFTTIDLDGGTDNSRVQTSGVVDVTALGTPTVSNAENGFLEGSVGNDDTTMTGAQLDALIFGSGFIDYDTGTDILNLTSVSSDVNTLGTATDNDIQGLETISYSTVNANLTLDISAQTEDFTLIGGVRRNTILGGSGNDTIVGNTDRDTFTGGAGADIISGDAGDDEFNLANGDFAAGESLTGGADTDTIILTNSTTVDFTTGTLATIEIFEGSVGNDDVTISGTQLNQFTDIDFRGGSDVLQLTSTSTGLNALANNDLQGLEEIDASTAAGSVTIDLSSQAEDFIVTGSGNDDTLTAGAGDDTIDGGAGVDIVLGGDGNDIITGGTGNDVLGGNNVQLRTVAEVLTANPTLSYNATTGNFYTYIDSGSVSISHTAALSGLGTNAADNGIAGYLTTLANAAEQTFVAGLVNGGDYAWVDGSDSLTEGTFLYESGPEAGSTFDAGLSWFGGSPASTNTTARDNVIIYDGGGDTLYAWNGLAFGYVIEWNGLDLTSIYGGFTGDGAGGETNTLNGGAGDDILYGTLGSDTLNGGADGDRLFGGSNDDTLNGDAGDDLIYGDAGDDILNGGTGNDTLNGGDDDDDIYGVDSADSAIAVANDASGITNFYTENFTPGAGGYTYADGVFGSAGASNSYASGSHNAGDGNNANGSVEILLGGINNTNINTMSGAWQDTFNIGAVTNAVVTFSYRVLDNVVDADPMDAGEDLRLFLDIDGTTYSNDANAHFFEILGTDAGNAFDSGWTTISINVGNITAGNHTYSFGGLFDAKSFASEQYAIRFDDISIDAVVAGTSTGTINIINGNDGLDTLYGSTETDIFVFDADAFNDIDVIENLDTTELDALDISDILTNFDGNISDYVQFVDSGGNSLMQIDANGTTGGASFTTVAQINGITGMDELALYLAENIIT